MKQIKIAVGVSLSDERVERIRSVSSRLHVTQISHLVSKEIRLLRDVPGSEEQAKATAQLDEAFRDVEVFLSLFRLPENVPVRSPLLKWVQNMGAGVERILQSGLLEAGVTLTNARGVASRPIAEWIVCSMLMFIKQMPEYYSRKQSRVYKRLDLDIMSLEGKTMGILGMGAIGEETAKLARAFGMHVLATRRTTEGPVPSYVDQLLPPDRSLELLGSSDFVAVTLPLTPATMKTIGEVELSAMKSTAYIFNVGRGALIDEPVLIRALNEGWIAGAGLDVFANEPLSKESELWAMGNVILTPHISGEVDDYDDRVVDLFTDNLIRYMNQQPLRNVVDGDRGY